MESKLLNINSIVIDEDLYPRNQPFWFTINKYAKAMKADAVFPNIVVASYEHKYYLVDGRHRIEATKNNKQEFIQADILIGLTREQIFVEAVKRNVVHGQVLSTQEVVKCIIKLEHMQYTTTQISKIVNVPIGDLKNLVSGRLRNTVTGEEIVLKSTLTHLEGAMPNNMENMQKNLGVRSQEYLLDQFITILENNWIDTTDKEVQKKLEYVHKLLEQLIIIRSGEV